MLFYPYLWKSKSYININIILIVSICSKDITCVLKPYPLPRNNFLQQIWFWWWLPAGPLGFSWDHWGFCPPGMTASDRYRSCWSHSQIVRCCRWLLENHNWTGMSARVNSLVDTTKELELIWRSIIFEAWLREGALDGNLSQKALTSKMLAEIMFNTSCRAKTLASAGEHFYPQGPVPCQS